MKLLFGTIAFFLLVAILASSCKSSQKALSTNEIEALPKILEFSKSACRGECPYFDLTVYEGGWLVFDGKRYTQHQGKAIDQLSKIELINLKKDCQLANLWEYKAEYGMNIMDVPTTTIHFYEKAKDKKVQYRMMAPQALPDLSNKIMEIVYARNWVKRLERLKSTETKAPLGVLDNEIIVQFNDQLDASKWCQQYSQYDLAIKRNISASTHLLMFDSAKINPDKMLALIKKNKQVRKAEFNKRLQSRSR